MRKYLIIGLITVFLLGCKRQKPLEQKGDYITISINPVEASKSVNAS
jgi:hypothetical protein